MTPLVNQFRLIHFYKPNIIPNNMENKIINYQWIQSQSEGKKLHAKKDIPAHFAMLFI